MPSLPFIIHFITSPFFYHMNWPMCPLATQSYLIRSVFHLSNTRHGRQQEPPRSQPRGGPRGSAAARRQYRSRAPVLLLSSLRRCQLLHLRRGHGMDGDGRHGGDRTEGSSYLVVPFSCSSLQPCSTCSEPGAQPPRCSRWPSTRLLASIRLPLSC